MKEAVIVIQNDIKDKNIIDILNKLGITSNTNGCKYIIYIVRAMIDRNINISKRGELKILYNEIADIYNTTKLKVIQNIYTSIQHAWDHASPEYTQFRKQIVDIRKKVNTALPSSKDLLNGIVKYILDNNIQI